MSALQRKAIADLRGHRLQVLLLFLILTAAAASLTLSLTVQRSANRPWERLFEATNGAHIVFFAGLSGEGDQFDLNQIKALEGVSAATGPFPAIWNQTVVQHREKHALDVFGLDADALTHAGAPLLTDGAWLSGRGAQEIVLDRSFARSVGLDVGDDIEFRGPNGHTTLTVAGLAVNPLTMPYPNSSPGTAYATPETLALLQPDRSQWGSALAVRLTNPHETSQFAFRARQLAPKVPLATTSWQDSRDELGLIVRINAVILGVVSLFALIAVGLIVANTIGGRVLAQFRDIGLLKAVGFTPRQITWLFLSQHLAIALAASLLGLAIGFALAPYFLNQAAEVFNTSASPAYDPWLALVVILGVLAVVTLCTLLPAWRGGHISTVEAITTGFAAVHARPSILARCANRLRLPTTVVLGVKDAFARPVRTWMSIAALTLTVVTVTTSLGVEATIQRLIDNPGLSGDPFNLSVLPGDVPSEEIERLLTEQPGIASYSTRTWVWAAAPSVAPGDAGSHDIRFGMRALGGDYQESGYLVTEGRMFAAPGEVVLSRTLLDLLGLKVGDELQVRVAPEMLTPGSGHLLTLRIVGRFVVSDNDGMIGMFPLESLRQVIPDVAPTSYAVQLTPDASGEDVKLALLEGSDYQLDVSVLTTAGTASDTRTIRSVLLGLSLVLVIIGVANLITTTVLGVRERARDFGIFKTLGLTPRQITTTVVAGVGVLAIIATLVGIPLGLVVSKLMFDTVGRNVAGLEPEVYARPNAWLLALIFPGAVLVAALSGALPARQAARVQVDQVLRNE